MQRDPDQNGGVHESWQFVDATEREREAFATLDATIARTGELAAPRNTHREVHRIEVDAERYYCKIFHRTQTKNRLRNALTTPRCGLDAEREAATADALRAAGIATARCVAVGRRGPASYYVCAELRGESIAELRARGAWAPDDDRGLAEFCGEIAARGIVLTDLSADHVFRTDEGYAVIDLHNGRTRHSPTRREWTRMLRRFAKSVRDSGVERRRAMRFALRVLARAGARDSARAVISALPPFDTHGRYDAGDRSIRYRERNPKRTARELDLLARVWPGEAGNHVADVPCGAGRLGTTMLDRFEVEWLPGDRSLAMLRRTREAHPNARVFQCDVTRLPFADRGIDGCIVFRLLHHLDEDAARAAVEEAARVADRWVVVTFFHPISTHNGSRWLRRLFGGAAKTRHSLTAGKLRRWMRVHGFHSAKFAADLPFLRDLWIGAFRRA